MAKFIPIGTKVKVKKSSGGNPPGSIVTILRYGGKNLGLGGKPCYLCNSTNSNYNFTAYDKTGLKGWWELYVEPIAELSNQIIIL